MQGRTALFPYTYSDASIAGSHDGTNLQDEHGTNTPWLAGLQCPYRVTKQSALFRAERSGGFEGMALSSDGAFAAMIEGRITRLN